MYHAKTIVGICLGLALAGAGCVQEQEKRLLADIENIGRFVKEHSSDPAIQGAGLDTELDAAEAMKSTGRPRNPPAPYTPAQSADLRKQAAENREARWNLFGAAINFVTNPVTGVSLLGLLTAGLGWLAKQRGTMNTSMSEGMEALKSMIPEKKKDDVDKTLRDIANDHRIYHQQKRFYRRMIAKRKGANAAS